MPTSLYQAVDMSGPHDDTLYFQDPESTGHNMFASDMLDPSSLLNVPSSSKGTDMNNLQHRHSPSGSAPSDTSLSPSMFQQAFSVGGSSRLPSLSPSTQSMHLSTSQGHSPRSSASPSSNSNFSYTAADDFLFNSFSSADLDMLFTSDQSSPPFGVSDQAKPGQSLFLPGQQNGANPFQDAGNLDFFQNLLNGSMPINLANPADESFDMLNLAESPLSGGSSERKVSDAIPGLNFDFAQQARAIGNVAGVPQQAQGLHQQNMMTPNHQGMLPPGHEAWSTSLINAFEVKPVSRQPPKGHSDYNHPQPAVQEVPIEPVRRVNATVKPAARQPKANAPAGTAVDGAVPIVGKHNKTERRYRQKVQAAQADLRDAIPALRVLYDTSTEEQKQTTDFRAPDGTVDGLGEVTRPNASAKATILIGARMYIELLQKRSAMLQRKVNELEAFRLAVAGEDDFRGWQGEFDAKEREIQAAFDAAALLKMEDDSLDEDDDVDEEEDNEPKRKKPKTVAAPKAPRAKPGPKSKKDQAVNLAQTAVGGGLRVFAAFAMSFSFLPSASTVLKQDPAETTSAGQVLASGSVGSATTRQIVARLPLITAEHTSRLLARSLPAAVVPAPHTLIDWTWRLLVAVLLAMCMSPVIARWTKPVSQKRKAGNLEVFAADCAALVMRRKGEDTDAEWTKLAAGIVGGSVRASAFERLHVILHLNVTATSAHSLALLALLQPALPWIRSPRRIWQQAQSKVTPETPAALATVLRLPLAEVNRSAELLEKTSKPIVAIAEQITLVHVHDLYSRFFVKLVEASTRSQSASNSNSVSSLLANLESQNVGSGLRSSAFDKEIRTVIEGLPRGSAAHALVLVLIGLWSVFTRPAPSAQAALAAALAAEQVQGAGAGLSSVSAMLDLLYPGSRDILARVDRADRAVKLPRNAMAIDKLATACIDYIRLLTSSAQLNDTTLTRVQRLDASRKVQKASAHLRLVLTQTKFVGLGDHHYRDYNGDDVSDDGSEAGSVEQVETGLEGESKRFDMAKERLVRVLCEVGRRAAGRASGRDNDSGLEGDLEEL
ncbi:hypothetical protein IAU60_001849 [Kwoniella sp. DSM 27419]